MRLARQQRLQFGWQVASALAQCIQHAHSRFACRCRQGDSQLGILGQQTGQQGDDGGRLAGARAAADDRQPAPPGEGGGQFLPVRLIAEPLSIVEEHPVESMAQLVARWRSATHSALPKARRQAALVSKVAVQVETSVAVKDQWQDGRQGWRLARRDDHLAGQQALRQLVSRMIGEELDEILQWCTDMPGLRCQTYLTAGRGE